MNKWLLRFLTVLGPAFAVMLIAVIRDYGLGIPSSFWDLSRTVIYATVLFSLPQIAWSLICLFSPIPNDVYWGGLISAQTWLVIFWILSWIGALPTYPKVGDLFHLYFLISIALLIIGAFCGFLFHKFQPKEPAA